MEENQIPIACRLNALTSAERAQEGVLLQEHLSVALEIRERADGYSFRYPSDPAVFARMAELVSLEHRCCSFLNFQLEWIGAQDSPWLHITGGARVKSFLADTFAARMALLVDCRLVGTIAVYICSVVRSFLYETRD